MVSIPFINVGVGTIVGAGLTFAVVIALVGWMIFNKVFSYNALIYQETGTGGYYLQSKARIFIRDRVKQLQILKFKDAILPPPTLDTITNMRGGKPLIQLWRDVNGNMHPVRWTRFSPALVEDGDTLKQLEQEVLVEAKGDKVKAGEMNKKGWFSLGLNKYIRDVFVRSSKNDKKFVTKKIAVEESVFSPDNRDSLIFIANALRRNHERHTKIPWYQQTWFTGLAVIILCMFALIITGYYVQQLWSENLGQVASVSAQQVSANKYFRDGMVLAGRNVLVAPQTGNVIGNVSGVGG